MTTSTASDKSFSEWAQDVYDQHPEMVEDWHRGDDPVHWAMATMIREAVGLTP